MPQWSRSGAAVALLVAVAQLPAAPAQTPPVESRHVLIVNGTQRSYLLYSPASQPQPLPLLLVFHGGGGRAPGMARHTGFTRVAEREGFLVVYPEGLDRRWNDGRGSGASHDDVGFIRSLLDTLRREFGLDQRRIYATGISNGAIFSYRLACELPGVFAAIAPVASAMPADLASRCTQTMPLSVVAFQGTADPLMEYAGGEVGTGRVLSADSSIGFWAEVAGCGTPPTTTLETDLSPDDGTRVRRTAYPDCPNGKMVELYSIVGGGHTWPGGPASGRRVGPVSRDIDATEAIWKFFARHPKP